jgi:hypothetical protein
MTMLLLDNSNVVAMTELCPHAVHICVTDVVPWQVRVWYVTVASSGYVCVSYVTFAGLPVHVVTNMRLHIGRGGNNARSLVWFAMEYISASIVVISDGTVTSLVKIPSEISMDGLLPSTDDNAPFGSTMAALVTFLSASASAIARSTPHNNTITPRIIVHKRPISLCTGAAGVWV